MTSPNPASVRGSSHPYYASEGCFYASGYDFPHYERESWQSFVDEMGDADLDLNLLYRWDWTLPDPGDFEPGDPEAEVEHLRLFYMQQRKARPTSYDVKVLPSDEPEIRAFLEVRAAHLALLWTPLAVTPATQET